MDAEFKSLNRNYKPAIFAVSLFSILIGILVLIGHRFNIVALKSILPFWISMRANTAICFILSGVALWLVVSKPREKYPRYIVNIISITMMIFSGLVFCEYFFTLDFGIDQFFFKEPRKINEILFPGRTSIATNLDIFLLGLSFLLIDKKLNKNWLFQIPALLILIISFFGFLDYFYNVTFVYSFTYYTKMAIHTAFTFILLSVAILLSRPKLGIIGFLFSDTPGGWAMRTLLPLTFILSILLGFLEIRGEKMELYGSNFGDDILLTGTLVSLSIIICVFAYFLNKKLEKYYKKNKID